MKRWLSFFSAIVGQPAPVAADVGTVAYATDSPRAPQAWWRRKRTLGAAAGGLTLVLLFAILNQFLHAHSTRLLANGEYAIGEVERGFLAVTVQGAGTLRPADERWLTAKATGILAELPVQIGAYANAGDVIARLTNPEMEQLVRQAEYSVAEARASHIVLLAQIEDRKLASKASLAAASAAVEEVELRLEAEEELLEKGAISAITYEATRISAKQAQLALDIERSRASQLTKTTAAEKRASEARLANLNLSHERALDNKAALEIKAENSGVVQEISAKLGESVVNGSKVAKIVDLSRLRAVARVPESYASKLSVGQEAEVRVSSVDVPAVVSRVDPSVTDGSVVVDLELTGSLPQGVRPDLSIRATITVAEIEDTLFVRRPSGAVDDQTTDVFVLNEAQGTAARKPVQFGVGMLSHVQVIEGLDEGDRIVLANTARFRDVDVVSIE